MPQAMGASEAPLVDEANTDNFFSSLTEPQCGHLLPFQSLDRTSNSESFSQARQ